VAVAVQIERRYEIVLLRRDKLLRLGVECGSDRNGLVITTSIPLVVALSLVL
jgi:hypothetical protein